MKEVIVQKDAVIDMRDGVRLAADIYRPSGSGCFPVLLQRTAYGKNNQTSSTMLNAIRAAEEGYVVVIADSRGRYSSEGVWEPFVCEIDDGFDTVEWCAAQPWSDGNVGMYGMSYVGATQWLAAIAAPPHLRCIFPVMTAADYKDGWVYQGGAFSLAFTSAWTAQFLAIPQLGRLGLTADQRGAEEARLMGNIERLRRSVSHLPLVDLPMLAAARLAPYFYDWLRRPDRDSYWELINISAHHDRISVPAFNLGGWYDLFVAGPPRNFAGLREKAASETARKGQKLVMGPWTHNSPSIAVAGERNFGFDATVVLEDLQLRWFDHWLKGKDTGLLGEPPVRIYVMGDGWRDEADWPPPGVEYRDYFLHSGGRANSLNGDGTLSLEPPKPGEPPDIYLYNPLNPVGTVGGGGVWDQRSVEQRVDVLVYSTSPLNEAVEVTGPVKLFLNAASTATDTDFYAKLLDVAPSGYAQNLCEGILRARYRDSPFHSVPLEAGRPYEVEVDMLVTSNRFLPGHAIRLEVTSSCFPRFDRNTNTGERVAEGTATVPAVQTVFHDGTRPSRLVLPTVRARRG